MPMFSTGLRDDMLDTSPFKTLMDDGFLVLYNGTAPASADAALSGNTVLLTYSDNGGAGGLDFAAAAASGTITKDLTQVWKGTVAVTGTPTFWRFILAADTGALSTTEKRIQGTVGTVNADLNLSSLSLTALEVKTINYFYVTLPTL